MNVLKVVAAVVFAFALPPLIFTVADMVTAGAGCGFKWGGAGFLLFSALMVAAPFAGFMFIVRPFTRWSDLSSRTLRFMIAMAALYWTLFLPTTPLLWLSRLYCGL